MPLVMSGTPTTPPLPVVAVAPGPSRLNQVSSVNVVTPSAGAAPNVTRSSRPSKRSAYPAGALSSRGIPSPRTKVNRQRTAKYLAHVRPAPFMTNELSPSEGAARTDDGPSRHLVSVGARV